MKDMNDKIKLNINFDLLIDKDAFEKSSGKEINEIIKAALSKVRIDFMGEGGEIKNIQWR